MKPSQNGYDIVKRFEGLRLKAYLDAVGVPTIGYGNTFYEDGTKVKMGDEISLIRAEKLLELMVDRFAESVLHLITSKLNQNQFDALVSFAYNVGIGNLSKSTLLKKVNANPNDPTILSEFLKWDKAKGQTLPGLTKRRKQEAVLYLKGV